MAAFGVRVHGGMPPQACVDLAVAAERAGFGSVWFAENPFGRGVLPAMAATALATRRLRIGIGVFNPYNRHPTLMAMEAAALDELADGRLVLGIGSGIGTAIERMGLSYARPIAAIRDAVAILRGLLGGETVSYEGRAFSVRDVRLEYPPTRAMPIHVAAMGEQALRLCGEVADGLIISNMCPPDYTRRAIAVLAEGAARAGRPPPGEIVQYVPCVCRTDGDAARAVVKGAIGGMLSAYWRMGERWPAMRQAMAAESHIPEADILDAIARMQAGEAAWDVLDQRFVDAYAIAGTPADCAAGSARLVEAGATEIVLTLVGTGHDMALLGQAFALGGSP